MLTFTRFAYISLLVALILFPVLNNAQSHLVEGIVFDDQNQRKLDEALIDIYNKNELVTSQTTDNLGRFSVLLDKGEYTFSLQRVAFHDTEINVQVKANLAELKLPMQRLPGYEFEATVKELLLKGKERSLGKEIKNLRIEIFNNSSGKEIKTDPDDPDNTFKAIFERNNHYTILIRKKGYFAKRIEAFVDKEGCILCFEGLGNNYAPEMEYATTDNNQRGIIIADIPMRKIVKNEAIRLDNIYYDFDKWHIRPDARPALDELVKTLKQNPIVIELSSHTDCRGNDDYNMTLSEKRAQSAVDYIIKRGIKPSRITARGYGESKPLNKCIDGVACSEAEYQYNRRTEFKVTAFIENTTFDNKTLREILEEEKITKKRSIEKLIEN